MLNVRDSTTSDFKSRFSCLINGSLHDTERKTRSLDRLGILLSNVRSLCNKMDVLHLLIRIRIFSLSFLCVLTESWLCESTRQTPPCNCPAPTYRDQKLSHKTQDGGICFDMYQGWCNVVKVILQTCSPDLESFCINWRLLVSLHIGCCLHLLCKPNGHKVYSPTGQPNIRSVERLNPDSPSCPRGL